jgi:hypothetical protein
MSKKNQGPVFPLFSEYLSMSSLKKILAQDFYTLLVSGFS